MNVAAECRGGWCMTATSDYSKRIACFLPDLRLDSVDVDGRGIGHFCSITAGQLDDGSLFVLYFSSVDFSKKQQPCKRRAIQ